jgi:hypothetical protein
MMKSLDPSIQYLRDALLPVLTDTLADLVGKYPNVAFNATSQRLVIGNQDGTCAIYDVRTASKLQILEVYLCLII